MIITLFPAINGPMGYYPFRRKLAGIKINLDGRDRDIGPDCDPTEDPLCPGASVFNLYTMEVIQRIGYDSFTPDQGVLISKNKNNESARSLHPTDTSKYLNYDIYRLSYELEGEGWDAHLQSVIVAVPFGEKIKIPFGIKKSNKASNQAIIKINCTSESDPGIQAESTIVVKKNNSKYKRHP